MDMDTAGGAAAAASGGGFEGVAARGAGASAPPRRAAGPPAALLWLYALLAFAQSLPLTAVAQLLQAELRMDLAAQSTFWATGFLPWCMRPLWGAASDALLARGAPRRAQFAAFALIAAALYAAMGAVFSRSVGAMFASYVARNIFEAAAETTLGAALCDWMLDGRGQGGRAAGAGTGAHARADDAGDDDAAEGRDRDSDVARGDYAGAMRLRRSSSTSSSGSSRAGSGSSVLDGLSGAWASLGVSAAGLQSATSGARYAGTLAATGAASALFPCDASRQPLSARAVLALAGAFMMVAAAVAAASMARDRATARRWDAASAANGAESQHLLEPLLQQDQERTGGPGNRGDGSHGSSGESPKQLPQSLSGAPSGPARALGAPLPLVLFVGAMQLNALWLGMRPLVHGHVRLRAPDARSSGGTEVSAWALVAVVLSCASTLVLVAAAAAAWAHRRRTRRRDGGARGAADDSAASERRGRGAEGLRGLCKRAWRALGSRCSTGAGASTLLLPSCAYVFLASATPSASVQWGSFEFAMFGAEPCKIQALSTLSAVASLLAALVFGVGAGCRGWSLPTLAAVSTLMATAGALLPLPLAYEYAGTPSGATTRTFGWVAAIHVAQTLLSQVAFLPRPSLALDAAVAVVAAAGDDADSSPASAGGALSAGDRGEGGGARAASRPRAHAAPTGAVYGALLAMMDLGDTVGGWLTAPIVSALDLTLDDYSRLPALLWIGAGCRLATLALVPLLFAHARACARWKRAGAAAGAAA